MNVLTVNHEFPPVGGGAAPVSFALCKHLARLGHRIDVVTMRYDRLPGQEAVDGVRIFRTPALRASPSICRTHEMATYLLGALPRALALARQRRYDVIQCHFIIPAGPLALCLSRLTGIPFVLTCHGSDVPGFNPDRFTFLHKFTRPLLRAVCSGAAAITAPSVYLADLVHRNVGPYAIEHIPNGIDLEDFRLDGGARKENVILATGRLLKRKGFQTLIRAVRDVELPFEVHIAGEGPYRPELEKLAASSRTPVILHGWLPQASPELRRLYERASIYVLVSSRENASVSLLEGMAARCAVITTNVTGCPETVGDAGFLIDFDDAEALRGILLRLSADPRLVRQYGERAHARLLKLFLWEDIVRKYEDVFRRCLNRQHRARGSRLRS